MRKKISLVLALTLLASSCFTGCSKKQAKTVLKIEEGTPWYNCETTTLGNDYADYEYNIGQASAGIIGHISDGYVYAINGAYGGYDSDTGVVNYLSLYSDDGELISEIDVNPYFANNSYYASIDGFTYSIVDDVVKVQIYNWEFDNLTEYEADFENKELVNPYVYPQVDGWNWSYLTYEKIVGDYHLFVEVDWDTYSLKLLTIDADGNPFYYDVSERHPENAPENVYSPIVIDDTKVLILPGFSPERVAYVFDLEAQEFEVATDKYESMLNELNYIGRWMLDPNNELYLNDGVTLSRPNFQDKTFDKIIDMENIDINRSLLSGTHNLCSILELSSDQIIFADRTSGLNSVICNIYKVTLADTNPNVGKTIITTDGTEDIIYEAVYRFNRTDDEYFVKIVPNNYNYYVGLNFSYDDDYETVIRKARKDMGDQIMVDLMAGNCPDVVFYATEYEQLNNGKYMLDMSKFYDNSNLDDIVYGNLIEATKDGDKLYAIPLQFMLRGIGINRKILEGDNIGLTFEEFTEFMNTYTNGKNPVAKTQLDFIQMMVANNYDLLLDDKGRINFDCDEFRQIAEYTYDYLNQYSYDYITCIDNPRGWFEEFGQQYIPFENADFIGFPSCDGRGPMMDPKLLVSITSDSQVSEGAWRFICMLLDDAVQTYMCSTDGKNGFWVGGIPSPVNRQAYLNNLENHIDAYNFEYGEYNEMGLNSYELASMDVADKLLEIVANVNHSYKSDSDIDIIIYEEMQPYLAGDKTLDEVIKIMNDRAKTVMDERGD